MHPSIFVHVKGEGRVKGIRGYFFHVLAESSA